MGTKRIVGRVVFMMSTIRLTEGERRELGQRAASRSGRADDCRRARLLSGAVAAVTLIEAFSKARN